MGNSEQIKNQLCHPSIEAALDFSVLQVKINMVIWFESFPRAGITETVIVIMFIIKNPTRLIKNDM